MRKKHKIVGLLVSMLVVGCAEENELEEVVERKKVLFTTKSERSGVAEYPNGEYSYNGLDFVGWDVVIGDANYVATGEAPITINDIETEHQDSISVLSANISGRYIMTHNITYKKIVSNELLLMEHMAMYQFKIPYLVSTQNTSNNGQTVEGGLFVWDGATTQLDYGLAFQWVTNPWVSNFGDIRYWDGTTWQYLTHLTVDTNYHELVFELDFKNNEAFLTLDGTKHTQNIFSSTTKTGWGTTIDGRFQAEAISIYPSEEASTTPIQEVYFKDWLWEGTYYD